MIKQITGLMLVAGYMMLTPACKEMKPNSPMEEAMKDSVFEVISEAKYTRIEVKEHQDVTVTIGSERLFSGTEERRKEVIEQLEKMTIHYFEENNYLDEGKVIFVPNETTVPTDDDPKKEYDMNLKALLKKE